MPQPRRLCNSPKGVKGRDLGRRPTLRGRKNLPGSALERWFFPIRPDICGVPRLPIYRQGKAYKCRNLSDFRGLRVKGGIQGAEQSTDGLAILGYFQDRGLIHTAQGFEQDSHGIAMQITNRQRFIGMEAERTRFPAYDFVDDLRTLQVT